ncbi:MAG: hypothetical protein ACLPIC_01190 [Rhodoblastus sp.]|uniref:hypothetical protein n=1 Tax=Rhodoblastus sp. TaxID=1962975 RepID=UPI003F97462E
MAKHRPSLEAFAQASTEPAATEAAKVVELKQPPQSISAPAPATQGRKDRPHVSLYLDKKVQRVIKEVALQYDKKPHDLYLEAIDLMLTHYGRASIKDLSK